MIQHISDYCNIKLAQLVRFESIQLYYESSKVIDEKFNYLNRVTLEKPDNTSQWSSAINTRWKMLFWINSDGDPVELKMHEMDYIEYKYAGEALQYKGVHEFIEELRSMNK